MAVAYILTGSSLIKTEYKVDDVVIGGSSMAIKHRNDFAALIGNNGGRFDALLAIMRK